MPIPSKMRTLADAGLHKYKWCNNLREVEQVDIFFLKDIADTIRYIVGNNIGFLYHNKSKLFVCVPNSLTENVQHAVSQLFNSNIVVEYQDSNNLIDILSVELGALLGEDNFSIKIDNDTQMLHLELAFAVQSKVYEVKQLLSRVMPINLNIDILVNDIPDSYTRLEYIQGSGTQWINSGISIYGWGSNVGVEARFLVPETESTTSFKIGAFGSRKSSRVQNFEVNGYEIGLIRWGTESHPRGTASLSHAGRGVPINISIHDKQAIWSDDEGQTKIISLTEDPEWFDGPIYVLSLNENNGNGAGRASLDKMYYYRLFNGQELVQDLVPVLDADGTPCMYDKISNQCLYNSGTGVFGYRIKTPEGEVSMFSLRDPYYIAPSGVCVKLIAENELDIIADTDIEDGEKQGYMWFANTGEAFEHFDIK